MTYTHLLVKAVALALKEYPIVNSIVRGYSIYMIENINIGVAVALEDGLIVPVINDAHAKSLSEIASALNELAEEARRGDLSVEEVTEGTFTITNLGIFDIEVFTPIINSPQVAILGVGKIVKKPVVIGEEIVPRSMMALSLTADHRVIDGALAARFLQRVKHVLEAPDVLLE